MSQNSNFDLIVIGAGPAGYVAAIRAAQLGMNVALVEGRENKALGGTCLNVGCIPSKAMLDSSYKYEAVQHDFAKSGVQVSGVKLDLKTMLNRKDDVVKQLTGGIEMLMKKNKITVLHGWAKLGKDKTVQIGKDSYSAKNIIIATGSTPIELPFAKFDGDKIVDSTDALSFDKVPENLVVIGAGVIGLELGSVWRRLGANVTCLDMADRPVAIMDSALGKEAQKIFAKQGIQFELGVKVTDIKLAKTVVTIFFEKDGKKQEVKADKVLVAVGRRANTEGLGLDDAGIKHARGVIQVDDHYKTSADGIYAIGDCIPGPMLAHKGEEEGVACVELLAGQAGHVNYKCIPWVVYTEPEIAGVGLSEDDAKEQGVDIAVGKFSFRANGRALAMGEGDGFVKVIADKKTDKLLGCHIIGFGASELIAEAVSVMEFGGSAEDIARTVHAHPTLSEAVKEAALAVSKSAIHG
jgi:dihydrolipoamide dehydrogenase